MTDETAGQPGYFVRHVLVPDFHSTPLFPHLTCKTH